jgi:hypothetical protein
MLRLFETKVVTGHLMVFQGPNIGGKKEWAAVHSCVQCGHGLKLGEIDLKSATTGIVVCPVCEWSGPIEIQIVERKSLAE